MLYYAGLLAHVAFISVTLAFLVVADRVVRIGRACYAGFHFLVAISLTRPKKSKSREPFHALR